jgi:hypothetical protein
MSRMQRTPRLRCCSMLGMSGAGPLIRDVRRRRCNIWRKSSKNFGSSFRSEFRKASNPPMRSSKMLANGPVRSISGTIYSRRSSGLRPSCWWHTASNRLVGGQRRIVIASTRRLLSSTVKASWHDRTSVAATTVVSPKYGMKLQKWKSGK